MRSFVLLQAEQIRKKMRNHMQGEGLIDFQKDYLQDLFLLGQHYKIHHLRLLLCQRAHLKEGLWAQMFAVRYLRADNFQACAVRRYWRKLQ